MSGEGVSVEDSIMDIYVDESVARCGDRDLLVLAAVTSRELDEAAKEVAEAKTSLGLPLDYELKWSSKGGAA